MNPAKQQQPRCDVCGYRDNRKGLTMITCKTCKLTVHKECYGMDTYKQRIFECWACQSVGKSFQIEKFGPDGKRMSIVQEKRPTKCDLCSISSGIHAMHPLYDSQGKTARQLFFMKPVPRLSWVHSLCAFLSARQGFVYGCDRQGTFDSMEDLEDDDEHVPDDRSINPELARTDTERPELFGSFVPVHHFVYYVKKRHKEDSVWIKAVERRQADFRCMICNKDDSPNGVRRIPLLCTAGADDEHVDFKDKHFSLEADTQCHLALHVGCARWGGANPAKLERVYYFPGNSQLDPVSCVYCNLHAQEVSPAHKPAANTRMIQQPSMPREVPNSNRPFVMGSPKTIRKTIQLPNKSQEVVGSTTHPPVGPAATQKASRPEPKPQFNQQSIVDRMYRDLYKRTAENLTKEERQAIVKHRKKHWAAELASSLSPNDFKAVWRDAKDRVRNVLIEERERSQASTKPLAPKRKVPPTTIDLTSNATAQRSLARIEGGGPVATKKRKVQDGQARRPSLTSPQRAVASASLTTQRASHKPAGTSKRPVTSRRNGPPKEDNQSNKETAEYWSHLFVGPDYNGKIFEFGEWDSIELIE